MNPKTLIGLVVLLVALVAVFYGTGGTGRQTNRPTVDYERGMPLLGQLEPEFVSSVALAHKDDTLRFARRDDQWFITHDGRELPASKDGIERLLTSLSQATLHDVATTQSQVHELYEVDDATAARITIQDTDGKQVADLLLGKAQEPGQRSFVRFPGENAVLLATSNLNNDLRMWGERKLDPDTWINKQLWELDQESIHEVSLTNATGTVVLRRSDDETQWHVLQPETFEADPNKVTSIISRLSRPWASELLTDVTPELSGLETPAGEVVISVTPEGTHTLLIGDKKEHNRYAMNLDKPEYVYTVSDYSYFTDMFKPVDDWRKPPPAPEQDEEPDFDFDFMPELPSGQEIDLEGLGIEWDMEPLEMPEGGEAPQEPVQLIPQGVTPDQAPDMAPDAETDALMHEVQEMLRESMETSPPSADDAPAE